MYMKNLVYCKKTSTFTNRALSCYENDRFDCKFDENCNHNFLQAFRCVSNSKEIGIFQVCNYIADCEDESDELLCGINFKLKLLIKQLFFFLFI